DREVGDGTTSVVLLAAELLRLSVQLIKDDLHPTAVIAGYRLAMKESVRYLKSRLSLPLQKLEMDFLLSVAKTSLASKFIAAENNFFPQLCCRAVHAVKTVTEKGETKYPVDSISILKTHGKSARDSELVDGFALKASRAAQVPSLALRVGPLRMLCHGVYRQQSARAAQRMQRRQMVLF
ncbi:T-complex protein 1 subunit alpha, related, partial [Eimeria tenella]